MSEVNFNWKRFMEETVPRDKDELIKFPEKTWVPTAHLRWHGITVEAMVLQQLWKCMETYEEEWRTVLSG